MPFKGPSGSTSFFNNLKQIDYSQWQRAKSVKEPASAKVSFPLIKSSKERKKEEKWSSPLKSTEKPSGGKPFASNRFRITRDMKLKTARQKAAAREMMIAKSMENIKILQRLSKAKMNSLEELKHHSNVLVDKNRQLVEVIKETDVATAARARDLLQQYDMFGTVITGLQDSSQNQVGVARAQLQETEKRVEKNIGRLEQEVNRVNTKVQSLQEELNILRTYMDKEYPVKAVQIASLLRSIRILGEEQQDELEDVVDVSNRFMETLAAKAEEEKDRILQRVAEEVLLQYQDGLKQMMQNNQVLRRQIEIQKTIIEQVGQDIEALHEDIMTFHHTIKHPRDVIFADVLLRRPKCTPDMEIILDIPTEEDLPL